MRSFFGFGRSVHVIDAAEANLQGSYPYWHAVHLGAVIAANLIRFQDEGAVAPRFSMTTNLGGTVTPFTTDRSKLAAIARELNNVRSPRFAAQFGERSEEAHRALSLVEQHDLGHLSVLLYGVSERAADEVGMMQAPIPMHDEDGIPYGDQPTRVADYWATELVLPEHIDPHSRVVVDAQLPHTLFYGI